ncbi:AAA domain-containing protein [Streptococcus tangpeifui]|uniref:AAA domain-containing protein n=1 Tax=Streptococcus tangpeifui TaxID=2709400 RepID=UPI0013ECEAEA|nr:AAA domain-containing protein [Streptococcus sp. ZJ1593]
MKEDLNSLIFIKGKDKTSQVLDYKFESDGRILVTHTNGESYSYNSQNIEIYRYYGELSTDNLRYARRGYNFYNNVSVVKRYICGNKAKILFTFTNSNKKAIVDEADLQVEESFFKNEEAGKVFNYLKELSKLSEIKSDETSLLENYYKKINFLSKDTVLSNFLNPKLEHQCRNVENLIFPFGCNRSQREATKNAMENQISIIQGPPGTGKTQTILNILSNIILQEKTALVVSNNNSAIENIREKLEESDYRLDFLSAFLGKAENKSRFMEEQLEVYPNYLPEVAIEENSKYSDFNVLAKLFENRERIAALKYEISTIEIEYEHFKDFLKLNHFSDIELSSISAQKFLDLLADCENHYNSDKKLGLFFKIKSYFKYKIRDWSFYEQEYSELTATVQKHFYEQKIKELNSELRILEDKYNKSNGDERLELLIGESKSVLKSFLSKKYKAGEARQVFTQDELKYFKGSKQFLKDYPIVLSTTFSAKSSLNKDIIYDYLIIDEASQVDIVTGALALSCAKNVVVVGDSQQLSNIVTKEMRDKTEKIRKEYRIGPTYSFKNSFLETMISLFPEAKQTLLQEHYRCHPKIIQFCNQKFYNGELLAMTEDHNETDVLIVHKSVEGNHARQHTNQRELDIIKQEIIDKYHLNANNTGIIAPYRNQVNLLRQQLNTYSSDTVHKFQGREDDTMIITTVDNQITRFTDDPHLLNVAISRAKNKLILVTSGNKQKSGKNISDLLGYIKYQNFDVKDSQICSIFDYLYKQYEERRKEYLKSRAKISRFDSENLMFALLQDLLIDYPTLGVLSHYPLNKLVKNFSLMNDRERQYASHGNTHLDFLLFNALTKQPILAIEVDGYKYHTLGSDQAKRDSMKNKILEKYGIPIKRFATNGSGEREQLEEFLSNYKSENVDYNNDFINQVD